MRTLVRLSRFLKPFWQRVLLSVILSVATISSAIGLLGTSAFLISRASQQPSIAALQVAIVGVRFFGIGRGIFRYFERLISHSVNFKVLKDLKVWFYQKIEPLAPAVLSDYRSGDVLARATSDIDTLENFYNRMISPPIVAILVTVGVSLFAAGFHPRIGLILGAGMVASGVCSMILVYLIDHTYGKAYIQSRADTFTSAVETLQGMPDLVVYGQEQAFLDVQAGLIQKMEIAQSRLSVGLGAAKSLGVILSGLTVWLVLVFTIPRVLDGAISGVNLAVLVMITLASFEAINPLSESAHYLESSLESAKRVFHLADASPAVRDPEFADNYPVTNHLSIRNLSFNYSPDMTDVFSAISLDLPPGKRIAIVGPSGSGKTTLFKLLLRFWDYEVGSIRLGGIELRNFPGEVARDYFSVISQESTIYSRTVRSNLKLDSFEVKDEDLLRVLGQVGLTQWLKKLPAGLDAWIGEHGATLSGGEKRRLVIARALLKDAPIFLLDEPTSYLDAVTEKKVLAVLFEMTKGKSVIWNTHRLYGLDQMDEILVLYRGQFVERGHHDELVAEGGLYSRMLNLQNRHLQENTDEEP